GYYDRFLAQCRPDCQKIGLSLFNPIDLIIDAEPTDIRLNACITPEQTYRFTK
ncbi:MAG: 5-formyltetrahydrofolate cyclo-ligase, partial [Spirosoma sp.]|nr:5-formyltetrahydrofolate cyclo-ligase [Spirosoma sp.]